MEVLEDGTVRRKNKNIVRREENNRSIYMGDKYTKSNINKFSGNVFNGPTNIVVGCIGGEDWQWEVFTNNHTTPIDSTCENAKKWLELMR